MFYFTETVQALSCDSSSHPDSNSQDLMQASDACETFHRNFVEVIQQPAVMVAADGASKSLEEMQGALQDWKDPLSYCAALLVERLILKAMTLPKEDKIKLCSKLEQWLAGGNFGLSEAHIHASLLKAMRE